MNSSIAILILVVAALVLFILAAIPTPSRVNLQAAGWACLTLALLISKNFHF